MIVRYKFQARNSGDGKVTHYSLACSSCSATLDFGQKQDGESLFFKMIDKDTRHKLTANGLYIYQHLGDMQ